MRRRPARILDIDGTLCDVRSVRHHVLRPRELKDFDAFHAGSADCPPHQQALDYAVETVQLGMVPVVVTARMERWHDMTRSWLERYLRRHYDIRGAIDDNPEVIELWRSEGIPTVVVPGWDESR